MGAKVAIRAARLSRPGGAVSLELLGGLFVGAAVSGVLPLVNAELVGSNDDEDESFPEFGSVARR